MAIIRIPAIRTILFLPLNEVEQVICFSLLQTRLYLTVFIVMLNQAKMTKYR
ncbi:hypothetical protein HIE71_001138 [Escherichia coli]|nr:hypothetical protein [Escherichia coli]